MKYDEKTYPNSVIIKITGFIKAEDKSGKEVSFPLFHLVIIKEVFPEFYVIDYDGKEVYASIEDIDNNSEPV